MSENTSDNESTPDGAVAGASETASKLASIHISNISHSYNGKKEEDKGEAAAGGDEGGAAGGDGGGAAEGDGGNGGTNGGTGGTAPKEAEPALKKSEVLRMLDLGLGRGIDATDPTSWAKKSAFQVRRVTPEALIGTEEGGAVQDYEREVSSAVSMQVGLKTSVTVPKAPVCIFMEAEASRSATTTRMSIGKKVINRTVSFIEDFRYTPSENPAQHRTAVPKNGAKTPPNRTVDPQNEAASGQNKTSEQSKSVAELHTNIAPFEERLTRWISTKMKPVPTDPQQAKMTDDIDVKRKVAKYCFDFVSHFKVTHYVSEIELGALKYVVLSETEFNTRVKTSSRVGVEKLVHAGAFASRASKVYNRSKRKETIGKISPKNDVARGTHDEAVVGIKVQPITSLVADPSLQQCLKIALVSYMEQQTNNRTGPFLVAFDPTPSNSTQRSSVKHTPHYLKVNDQYQVVGETDSEKASHFYIITNDSGDHPYEFYLAYYEGSSPEPLTLAQQLEEKGGSPPEPQTPVQQQNAKQENDNEGSSPEPQPPAQQQEAKQKKKQHSIPAPCYLRASVNMFGNNPETLKVKYHASDDGRLQLFRRIGDDEVAVDPKIWAQGNDTFFINCARRKWNIINGYIAMKRRDNSWFAVCSARRKSHTESSNCMLFRLEQVKTPDTLDFLRDKVTLLDEFVLSPQQPQT